VHYWANLQSVHGFRCYDNIARTRNVSECLYSLYMPGIGGCDLMQRSLLGLGRKRNRTVSQRLHWSGDEETRPITVARRFAVFSRCASQFRGGTGRSNASLLHRGSQEVDRIEGRLVFAYTPNLACMIHPVWVPGL